LIDYTHAAPHRVSPAAKSAAIGTVSGSAFATRPPLQSLAALPVKARQLAADPDRIVAATPLDLLILDARYEPAKARGLAQALHRVGFTAPVLGVFSNESLTRLNGDWQLADFVTDDVAPPELAMRISRLIATARKSNQGVRAVGDGTVALDENALSAKIAGDEVELTYLEFKLISYLADNAARPLGRGQLIQAVWDADREPGSTSINVHVARIRRKLGPYAPIIRTVRNVGYQFVGWKPDFDEVEEKVLQRAG
jgi:DNA-binding response OmpR family regulator